MANVSRVKGEAVAVFRGAEAAGAWVVGSRLSSSQLGQRPVALDRGVHVMHHAPEAEVPCPVLGKGNEE